MQINLPEITTKASRAESYKALLPYAEALLVGESDSVANLANLTALLREAFGFFWVGFYRVVGDQLVLGPFQGSLACSRIAFGRGVCGTAWKEKGSKLVPDVGKFPGHIACDSRSRSEVVVPIYNKTGEVVAVLDIDSDRLDDFSQEDIEGLESLSEIIGKHIAFEYL